MKGISTIIWDWNGTLLNDLDICIKAINELLLNRNLPLLNSHTYLNVFGFPVKDYYQRIGFDFEKEPFEIPAHEYIEIYSSLVVECQLHSGVKETLKRFSEMGFTQLVLSASEQTKLVELLKHFEIQEWFTAIAGLNNHLAQSKTAIGIQLLKKLKISPETACLIGDTIHDFDVAQAIGCSCILVANGHQSIEKLKETGAVVINNLEEMEGLFKS